MWRTLVKNKVTVKCFFCKKTAYLLDFLFFFGDIYEIVVKIKEFWGFKMTQKYNEIYQKSIENREDFWKEISNNIFWYTKPTKILNSDNPPFFKWFEDGVTNTCYNALDLHVDQGNGEKLAIIYDSPITGSKENITYNKLKEKVALFAGALKKQGVSKGDRVIIYMPMIPEAVIAMLACGRIGAVHSVVFGGFAANELASRIDDSKAKILVTASCGYEPGRTVHYKPLVNKALELANLSLIHI